MITFGFSAFVKLLSLSDQQRVTVIRQRSSPSSKGGYDFHKQMRLLARRYILAGEPLARLLPIAAAITNPTEGRSAGAALQRLAAFRPILPGPIVEVCPAIYESPGHLFRVRFEPTFGLDLRGQAAPIEIWNTMKPLLARGPTYAALSIAAQAYEDQGIALENIGLLSLQEPTQLYLLTDVPRQHALASSIVEQVEEALRAPPAPPPQPEDQPFA